MNREEVIWASGIFEDEGCFYRNIIKKGTKTYVYPTASVRMTDEDTIRRFAKVFPFGRVTFKPGRVGRKDSWEWKVNGFAKTQAVMAAMWNGLGQRRKETAVDILADMAE